MNLKKTTFSLLFLMVTFSCNGADSEPDNRSYLSQFCRSTYNWWWNSTRDRDEETLWNESAEWRSNTIKTAVNTSSAIADTAVKTAQTIRSSQPLGHLSAIARYAVQSPYTSNIIVTASGAFLGSPELASLGLISGVTKGITNSIDSLARSQQEALPRTIHRISDRFERIVEVGVDNLNQKLTHQQQELGRNLDARADKINQVLTHQQQELVRTIDHGNHAIQETVSHTGKTAIQTLAYGSSILIGAGLVYKNLSKETITNRDLSLAALGGIMIAAPAYLSTKTMNPNPMNTPVTPSGRMATTTLATYFSSRTMRPNPLASRVAVSQ